MSNLLSDLQGFLNAVFTAFLGGNSFKILGVPLIWYTVIPIVMGLVFSLIKRNK